LPWIAATTGASESFDGLEHLGQGGGLPRLAELGHLGAGAEAAAGADQHDCPRTGLLRRPQPVQQPGAHLGAERVDGALAMRRTWTSPSAACSTKPDASAMAISSVFL
jgi:hypothetical protein